MKRTKKFAALAVVASLTLGCAVNAFAANSSATSTTGVPSSEVPVTTSDTGAIAPAETETAAAAPTFADLNYTQTTYYNDQKMELGVYPVVNAPRIELQDIVKTFNNKLYDNMWKQYTKFSVDNPGARDGNFFKITYSVTNEGQYAIIKINLIYNKKTSAITTITDTYTYYFDKETYTEVTEAQYNQAKTDLEAAAAAAEEATAATEAAVTEEPAAAAEDEVAMLGLRANATACGYSLEWIAAENAVAISFGEILFTKIVVGENKYMVDGVETALETAPVNQDGTIYVPASFFTKVLGATVTQDAEGNYTAAIVAE